MNALLFLRSILQSLRTVTPWFVKAYVYFYRSCSAVPLDTAYILHSDLGRTPHSAVRCFFVAGLDDIA